MFTLNDPHVQFASLFNDRAIAPLAYAVSYRLTEGHICVPLDRLEECCRASPYFENQTIDLDALRRHRYVGVNPAQRRPFMIHNDAVYLHRYFYYETQIINRIRHLQHLSHEETSARVGLLDNPSEPVATLLTPDPAATGIDWQLLATVNGFLNNFNIITGGPGTGKTTTVARILALLFAFEPDLRVAVAAPTGKAAARMAESLSQTKLQLPNTVRDQLRRLEPQTIHRLLGPIPNSHYFRHNADNPLAADVLVIDESSMIDAALLAKLLSATPNGCRVFLLGDKDQLASVEAGSVFGDLCRTPPKGLNVFTAERWRLLQSLWPAGQTPLPDPPQVAGDTDPLCNHIVALQHSRRFDPNAGIGRLAKALVEGNQAALDAQMEQTQPDDAVLFDTSYDDRVLETFAAGYEAYIHEPDLERALAALQHARVLCAVREGPAGVYEMNRRIEHLLTRRGWIRPSSPFYEHRPVMITQNDPSTGLFNGDVGIVRRNDQGNLRAWFMTADGGARSVSTASLPACETVFAMTIHKSQGSEFDAVMVTLPQAATGSGILNQELLYTAITRARKRVVLQSSRATLAQAVAAKVQRGSGIVRRLTQDPFLTISTS